MTLNDLKLRLRALVRPNRVEQDLTDELEFHIEREASRLIEQGMPPADARARARALFGSVALAADQCRDERGTALVDNTVRDIRFAFRTAMKAPLASVTIVATVAIGLGTVAVLFTVLNAMLFRVDAVPDIDQMYWVQRPPQAGGNGEMFTRPYFDAMRTETDVFSDAYAFAPGIDLRVNGRMMAVTLVTGNFFQVLRVNAASGRTLTPADDTPAGGNPVIVLSHKGWTRHFNSDPGVVGRMVLVREIPFTIIGVTPEGFRGLDFSGPDFWAPLSQLAAFEPQSLGREDTSPLTIVGRLKPEMSVASARAQLSAWDANRSAEKTAGNELRIDLLPQTGVVFQPMEALAVFTPLFVAFGLILLIGCANVANLLLARGVARQREIGIRLSLGASRKRIVRQLLTESILLSLVAAIGGYLISRFALETGVSRALASMPVDLGDVNLGVPAADWRVALFLVIAAVGATALFGLMPALQATRIDPVRTLRGELVRDARPGRARNALIGIQVFASALLLICAAIFLRSAVASSAFDPGLRTADTVLIDITNEPKRPAMTQALASERIITASAAVKPDLLAWLPDALVDAGNGKTSVPFKSVSSAYFDVLGIPIVRGRAFMDTERDQDSVAIVSESLARTLWPDGDGLGESIRFEPQFKPVADPPGGDDEPGYQAWTMARTLTVVGIARDVPGFRITDVKQAGVFLPTSVETRGTWVVARVQGPPNLARETLLDNLMKVDPAMGNIITMQTVARLEGFLLGMAFWVAVTLGGLALLLTVSGLFSVLSYLVEQRTREIGVRMALGATSRRVTQLMLAQTTRPVMYGLAIGASCAAALAAAVLSTPVGTHISQIVHVADPVAYLSSLAVIVTACLLAAWIPASRAARVDPMRTLRQD